MKFDEKQCREIVADLVGAPEKLGTLGLFEYAGTLNYMQEYVERFDYYCIDEDWNEALAGRPEMQWDRLSERQKLEVLARLANGHWTADNDLASEDFRHRIPAWDLADKICEEV